MSWHFTSCIHNLGFLHKEQLKKHTLNNIHWTARTAWAFWVSNIDKSTKLPQSWSTPDHQSPQPIRLLTSNPSFPGALPYTCHTHTKPWSRIHDQRRNHEKSGHVRDIQAKWRNMVLNVICQFRLSDSFSFWSLSAPSVFNTVRNPWLTS